MMPHAILKVAALGLWCGGMRYDYIIIGAGLHGVSTAYHLALQLKATGKGDGRDIIILDKSGVCSGATGHTEAVRVVYDPARASPGGNQTARCRQGAPRCACF